MPFNRQHCGRLQRASQVRRPELFTGLRSAVPFNSHSGALLTANTEQGAPVLAILDTETSAVAARWPAPVGGSVLQQNSSPGDTNWVYSPLTPMVEGTNKCVTISPPTGKHFYRLPRP